MKNILVPVDFSQYSLDAFNVAVNLAKRTEADLHVIVNVPKDYKKFVAHEFPLEFLSDDVFKDWVEIEKAVLDDICKKEGSSYSLYMTRGDLIKETQTIVSDKNIDLIVMGTHGASGIKQFTIGSNTQQMMRNVDVPVLIIKHEEEKVYFKNIVFLSTFNTVDIEPYKWTTELAAYYDAHVHLLSIDTPKFFSEIPFLVKSSMKEFQKIRPYIDTSLHYSKAFSAEEGLDNFLEKYQIDLVVVTTKGYKGIASVLHLSIAEGIVNHFSIPVVSMKV